jgi:hypothetical protein
MAIPVRESVSDTLENLIEQFSDVYCFYRELIQNSLDAGTNRVDVSLEFVPSEGSNDEGVVVIRVDDYGEGMNREIIDNQLTRLFSSSKENDLTKIGKFGIGFVSVFAIKPEAVSIDTSRDGEDWRVIFNKNKEFERRKRDYPVDGTKIQIFKAGSRKFYENFLKRSKETVIFWCRHSEAEIYFQDEPVNQPFEINSPCSVHVNESAGEVAAGYTRIDPPSFGFYNKGLTLMRGRKQYFPGVSFKIKSRYLEHTLTRDSIREDQNYWKAMELLNDIVKERLPARLFGMIQEELEKSDEGTGLYQDLLGFAELYFMGISPIPRSCRDFKVARDTEGGFITVWELPFLNFRGREVLYDMHSNPVTAAFARAKTRVIQARCPRLLDLVQKMSQRVGLQKNVLRASENYFVPLFVEEKLITPAVRQLLVSVEGMLKKMSQKIEPLRFADFNYPGSCISGRVFVVQGDPGKISSRDELLAPKQVFKTGLAGLTRKRTMILNWNHPYVAKIIALSGADPEMAAYMLAKVIYMEDGIDTDTDSRLALASLERRGM